MSRATVLEVNECTATIKQKIFSGSSNSLCMITCDKNGGCLALRLIGTSRHQV